jgi:hypothetical protein
MLPSAEGVVATGVTAEGTEAFGGAGGEPLAAPLFVDIGNLQNCTHKNGISEKNDSCSYEA